MKGKVLNEEVILGQHVQLSPSALSLTSFLTVGKGQPNLYLKKKPRKQSFIF